MKKTDGVLNGFIAGHWDSMVKSVETDLITKAPPNGVLQALANRCNEDSVGLFPACNIHTLANLTAITQGPEVQKIISDGRGFLISKIEKSDFSVMRSLKGDIKVVLGKWNNASHRLNNNLTELFRLSDPGKIDNHVITSLISNLTSFNATVPALIRAEFERGLRILKELNSLMLALSKTLTKLKPKVEGIKNITNELKSQLTDLSNYLEYPTQVLTNVSLLEFEVISKYNETEVQFLASFVTNDTFGFANLTREFFPCKKAHEAYKAVMSITCDPSGPINHAIGFITITASTILSLTLLYVALFTLASSQASQVRMLEKYANDNSLYAKNSTFTHPILEWAE
ncbi:unnamed protein product [Rodentolepis nana]|uniref:Prominin 1 b n=1 Tax=Rodentolepis nana TaxID=102285 RepID=A0A0R3TYZ7_RODNA|nr:unnamed protein product [Rodentolepis nana]